MSCRRVKKTLLEYTEGTLPEARAAEVREHIGACEGCAALAGRLELSGLALSSLSTAGMSAAASDRVLESIRSAGVKQKPSPIGLLRSPRAIAIAGGAGAVIIAVAVVIGLNVGGDREAGTSVPQSAVEKGQANEASTPADMRSLTTDEEKSPTYFPVGTPVEPVAKVTGTDYTPEILRTTFENMSDRRKFAASYTMSDAIALGPIFRQRLTEEFAGEGQDAPLLEGMITYVTIGEPVQLPWYVEKATMSGQSVFVLALAAPRRGSKSTKLTRTDIWVLNPEKFLQNPDSSLVFWAQVIEPE